MPFGLEVELVLFLADLKRLEDETPIPSIFTNPRRNQRRQDISSSSTAVNRVELFTATSDRIRLGIG